MKKHLLLFLSAFYILTLKISAQSCNFTYTAIGLSVTFNDATNWSPCSAAPNWNFGDPASGSANTSQASNPTHVFTAGGTYTVCLSSGHGATSICGTSFATKCTTITVTSTTGIKITENDLKTFSVYPNPSISDFGIKYDLKGETNVALKVYNLIGEEIKTIVTDTQQKGSYTYSSKELGALSKGIYFVKLTLNDSSKTIKVVVQ